ncbi:MAG: hypothetical protein H0U59_02585 [Gemmatimonadaceae bacterium]|nr:hypothetical protein [Gemmatimonadaceae bacterium]
MKNSDFKNLLVLARKGVSAMGDTISVNDAVGAWSSIAALQSAMVAAAEAEKTTAQTTDTASIP